MGPWSTLRCTGSIVIHIRHSVPYAGITRRGSAPKTQNCTPEFRGETRARVVLIGGGGAVTGTVSSLFSWVWYAFRDWPLRASPQIAPWFCFLSSSVNLISWIAHEIRDVENFLPKCFSEDFTEIFRSAIDHSSDFAGATTTDATYVFGSRKVFIRNSFLTRIR